MLNESSSGISLDSIDSADYGSYQVDERTQRGEIVGFVRNVDISQLVDQIIQDAVGSRTSDIHIEPFDSFLSVRFRIDGEFYEYRNFDTQYSPLILTRIQVQAWLKIDQLRIPQDWKINAWIIHWKRIDLRVSTLPTIYGNKVVIRILEKENTVKTLDQLGYTNAAIKVIMKNLDRTFGMVLMSWPTGSWKSTTLFAMLSKYDPFKYNISTLEDPVEYFIEGANQSQVNPEIGFDFSDWLRSLVRQDPDIIMVGEIRDAVTAKLATQAAITGHLVFSTVHANTSAWTVQRLMNMGADPFLVADALNLIVSQRLIKKNCPNCASKYDPSEKELQFMEYMIQKLDLASRSKINFARGVGCDNCHGSWYLWRIAIYEILEITPSLRKIIIDSNWLAQEIHAQAIKEGLVPIKDNGILKVLIWETSIQEVMIATDS